MAQTTTTITLRVPITVRDSILDRAEAAGQPMADWLRAAIQTAMDEESEADRLAQMEARICQHVTREIDSLTQPDGGQP
ncbi:hypothetical protein [Thermithiobacillus plumbiphilus]|uniref:Uncharacterized protein n=1 Tax=Thermithiobacillus plumbiphilus TaxID=1729899 RepID=A0ABU9D782_9PROT